MITYYIYYMVWLTGTTRTIEIYVNKNSMIFYIYNRICIRTWIQQSGIEEMQFIFYVYIYIV